MMRIFRTTLAIMPRQTIPMRRGAELLSVANLFGELVLFARASDEANQSSRTILVLGAGDQAPAPDAARFIGTALFKSGEVAWHVFDGGPA